MKTSFRFAVALAWMAVSAHGASLKKAEFTRVINDVRLLPSQQQPVPAKIGDTVSGQTAVSTGVASRAELRFPDKTLTRIGSNSVFKLDQADRTVNLEKGVMLLQVPKQLGGAKVRTAAVTAAVTGTTVMFEYDPNGTIKIIVLEGEVDVYLNDQPGVVRTLVAGDILIMNVNDKTIPLPGKVDLELLKKTSKLMDPTEFDPLGNQKHLADALQEQDRLKNNGELLKTAFEIVGRGTQVTLTTEARQEIFKNIVLADRAPPSGGGGGGPGGNNNAPGGNGGPDGGGPRGPIGNTNGNGNGNGPLQNNTFVPARPILNPGTTVFGAGSTIVTNPHATAFNSISGAVVTMQGTVYNPATDGFFNGYMYGDAPVFPEADSFLASRGSWFVFKGDALFISGNIGVNTTPGPRNVILGALGDVNFSATTPFAGVATDATWTLPTSVDALMITSRDGSITMDPSFALFGSGAFQDVAFYAYGSRSDVNIYGPSFGPFVGPEGPPEYTAPSGIHLPQGDFKAYAGRDIVADAAVIEARDVRLNARRDVKINSTTISAKTLLQIEALGKIQIQNSSQLVALSGVDPLAIMLKAINGNIEIADSFVDGTSVEMVSGNGSVLIGSSLPGSTVISADIVKAHVMPTGGELLVSNSILGRDTPAASSLIKLYGEGASGVRFSGDNTLNATAVDIAGRSVTIDAGGVVRLSHPANTRVFSDTANFNNGGTNGDFTNKAGVPVSVTKDIYDHKPTY